MHRTCLETCYIISTYTLSTKKNWKDVMGSLFEEIKKENSKRGTKSRIAEILEALPEEERKDLIKALDDHSIPASSISKALLKRGHKLAINVISRYRRGELVTVIK